MNNALLNPALSAQATAFAEHLALMVDRLPRRAESLPSRQAYFSSQAVTEQLARAGRSATRSGRQGALESALAEVRTTGYWLDELMTGMPEAARFASPLHEEADVLAAALVEATY